MLNEFKQNSIDLAKLALWPYLVGFLVSLVFYSQFRIFGMGLLSPHYILVGSYVAFLYLALPYSILFAFSPLLRHSRGWLLGPVVLLVAIDITLYLLSSASIGFWFLTGTLTILLLLQLAPFWTRRLNFDIRLQLSTWKVLGLCLAAVLHFSIACFGAIPYHFGGGKPAVVYVFPSKGNETLLSSQFSSPGMQVSPDRQSYRMLLLFETTGEYFFLRRQAAKIFIGNELRANEHANDNVVRVQKSTIDRLDFTAPRWIPVPRS